MEGRRYDALVDARGLSCPLPLVKARQALMVLEPGRTICVLATDPAAPRDFEDFTDASGHTLLDSREEAGVFVIVLEKRKG
ncbi:MAG: sulfurtransferase TusA family protein [Geminicoccaceae bacterium]